MYKILLLQFFLATLIILKISATMSPPKNDEFNFLPALELLESNIDRYYSSVLKLQALCLECDTNKSEENYDLLFSELEDTLETIDQRMEALQIEVERVGEERLISWIDCKIEDESDQSREKLLLMELLHKMERISAGLREMHHWFVEYDLQTATG
ncbi:hypothetical protein BS50DRAFT_582003 [Corynespora cassiicola Philippines]|uniref:Fungal N-terminal domain-containing protein n=1 Tax=Corynespora cassiicola Philippines TaxID=1448308 RepID=A0A2T2PCA0_CORCC|nr:hypothetical protein BS50DRAFT_582003 [Corynespora cassiicola Philippines]